MTTRRQTPRDQVHSIRILLAMLLLVFVAVGRGRASQGVSPFEMVGFIQSATLDDPTDVFSGGTITLNNQVVVVPRYTILQMPATAVTWAEVFKFAPPPYGPTQSGLALADTPRPFTTYDITVQGNRVADTYVAGLLFLSQQSVQTHQGFINFIDYRTGEMRVGGTPGDPVTGARVRLNDPIGRFGRKMSPDLRFTIDEDNPTVRTATGFPMCLPRTDPAVADDPACPQKNRPADSATGRFQTIFTMPPPPATAGMPDARLMAPFEVGDYVTYSGNLTLDGSISAWSIKANVGIFTAPGTQPAYVAIDVILMGTGNSLIVATAQEGAKRTRVEGFATDVTMAIDIFAVDVDPCTGIPTDRYWASQTVDPGPPNGAVVGRWRFRPGAPLFNLKGFPFLPPTREVHAVSQGGIGTKLANGLIPGQYQAPNFQFILPENLGVGNPPVPANLDEMRFLAQGSGPWFGGGSGSFKTVHPQGIAGQIVPFPFFIAPNPAVCATDTVLAPIAIAGTNQTVDSGAIVALNGSGSSDPNAPPRAQTYSWQQVSGPAVTLTKTSTATPTFWAPLVPFGDLPMPFQFLLTVDNGVFSSTAMTTVTVNPSPTVLLSPTANAGINQTVTAGTVVALSGIGADLNTPPGALTLTWSQTAGAPAVVLTPTSATGASPATAIFAAPTLVVGATPLVLTFTLTVNNGATPAGSSIMTVTVNPPAVPDVVGLTQAAAGTAITGVGLTVGTITSANTATVPAGSVISQNPLGGASVAPGSAVDLVISLGPAPPTVTGVAPNRGNIGGGTIVTITGTNFVAPVTVTFGGTAATSVVVVSSTSITATTPAHAAGAVSVAVTSSGLTATLAGGFTYIAPAFVRVAAATPQGSAQIVPVAYPAAQTAGNLNIVVVGWSDTTNTVTSVVDNRGNVYNLAIQTVGTGVRQSIYYASRIVGGATTVTVTFSGAAFFPDVRILEYAGVNTLDVTAAASGTGVLANSGVGATTTIANEVVFGASTVFTASTVAGAGYTLRILTPDKDVAEDRIVNAIGAYNATVPLVSSGAWVMQMVTFK